MTRISDLLPALASALENTSKLSDLAGLELNALPTTGLAHDHVLIGQSGWLFRVPRQSQMRLDARANLDYQAACFARCSTGGHAPNYRDTIPPSDSLPMGALIVEAIDGTTATLPEDLPVIAQALASIHALPLPELEKRAPLHSAEDPLAATMKEVLHQGSFIPAAKLDPNSEAMIEEEIAQISRTIADLPTPPPLTLISFDAHPGNFLVEGSADAKGRAVLVDLEKARYGGAGFDLAHATLYTSTTWDVATYSEPTHAEIAGFYQGWIDAMPQSHADSLQPHLMTMRRLMWLWSITWCAMWRVQSQTSQRQDKQSRDNTEDWSADNTEETLIAHVRDRVNCYLKPEIIDRVRQDWRGRNDLTALLS